MRISALLIVCGGLAIANAALAQDTTDGTDGTGDAPITATFDALSPGNQKIAESLFGGQSIPDGGTGEAWSLDRIAAAKQDGQGWGRIFKQMKADGLVDARNLGQLVSGQNRTFKALKDKSGTTGGTGDTATTDPDGTGTAGGDATAADAAEPTPEAGSFDQLSTGNQKIAESLFEGQAIPDNGNGGTEVGTEAWSLDRIAGAKQDGQGWGRIFKQMKAEGLVEARNLGQLVSTRSRAAKPVRTEGSRYGIVLTTASGRTMSFGRSKNAARGKGSFTRTSGGPGYKGGRKFSGVTAGRGGGGGLHSRGLSSGFGASRAGVSSGSRGGGGGSRGKSGKSR